MDRSLIENSVIKNINMGFFYENDDDEFGYCINPSDYLSFGIMAIDKKMFEIWLCFRPF